MITVTMMLWKDPASRRNPLWVYGVEHVNLLVRQIARHLTSPHEFVLVSDGASLGGLDARVRTVPLDRTTFVPDTRFAKLMLFRPDIGDVIGRRIFYLDLDTVVTGSLDAIAGRQEDVVLWRHPRWRLHGRSKVAAYNSSVMLLDAGVRPGVWTKFPRGRNAEHMRRAVGVSGEDQAWIASVLTPHEATWTDADGVYSINLIDGLPDNARLVTFPGAREPGTAEMQAKHPWIAEHRR